MDIYSHFIDNKYTKWYFNVINNACQQNRKKGLGQYFENHHIIPKCKPFCGSNNKNNLVLLTFREHYICHWLLTKMTEGVRKQKMFWALVRLSNKNNDFTDNIIPAWLYDLRRQSHLEATKLRVITDITRKKMSDIRKGKSLKHLYKNGHKGRSETPKSKEEIEKMRDSFSDFWKIIYKNGTIEVIKNLCQFGRDNNLNASALVKVSLGKASHHKGIRCYKLENYDPATYILETSVEPLYKWKTTYNSSEYFFDDLKTYSKKHNLSYTSMISVSKGKQNNHRGYTCEKLY